MLRKKGENWQVCHINTRPPHLMGLRNSFWSFRNTHGQPTLIFITVLDVMRKFKPSPLFYKNSLMWCRKIFRKKRYILLVELNILLKVYCRIYTYWSYFENLACKLIVFLNGYFCNNEKRIVQRLSHYFDNNKCLWWNVIKMS